MKKFALISIVAFLAVGCQSKDDVAAVTSASAVVSAEPAPSSSQSAAPVAEPSATPTATASATAEAAPVKK